MQQTEGSGSGNSTPGTTLSAPPAPNAPAGKAYYLRGICYHSHVFLLFTTTLPKLQIFDRNTIMYLCPQELLGLLTGGSSTPPVAAPSQGGLSLGYGGLSLCFNSDGSIAASCPTPASASASASGASALTGGGASASSAGGGSAAAAAGGSGSAASGSATGGSPATRISAKSCLSFHQLIHVLAQQMLLYT